MELHSAPLSITTGFSPARTASIAQARPVGPAPIETKSYVSMAKLVCRAKTGKANQPSVAGVRQTPASHLGHTPRQENHWESRHPCGDWMSSRCGVRFRRGAFELRKNFPQRGDQLVAGNMALLELNPELERLVLRLEVKNERLGALRAGLLLPALAPGFVARQATLQNPLKHLQHFLFGGLPRNLQEHRLGIDALLDALLAQRLWNISQRERFGH